MVRQTSLYVLENRKARSGRGSVSLPVANVLSLVRGA